MAATKQLESPARRPPRWPGLQRSIFTREPLVPLGRSSDERLARRATGGDAQALGEIFERYQQELYRFCLGLLGESQDAQDALQNTMVKALRALPGEEREIALRPWLYSIAHNEAINLRRRKRTAPLDEDMLDAHSSVEETAEHREHLQWLLKDFRDLPDRQRAVLVMRELSGLDFADIAAALDTSAAVVRQALYEARRNLEQMDFGRSMRCETVMRVLSDADARISSRREIRAHLRDCPACRHFQERIQARKRAFAEITPLPAAAAAGFLQSVLGGAGGSSAGGLAAGLGGGAGSIGAAGILKAVATVAVVTVVGTAAVERNSHDHGADRNVAAGPSSAAGRVGAALPAGGHRVLRRALSWAHSVPNASAPIAASAPRGDVGWRQPSAPARVHSLRDRGPAVDGGPSISIAPVPGKSSPPGQARLEPPEGQPAAEDQSKLSKKAEKQEEKTSKEEARGKPEHPTHPEHPSHPEHPARSEKQPEPPAPQESTPEAETTPLPEAEGSPELPSNPPNGKAKGRDKQLPAESLIQD